jgi:SAM-dependent methyltransferase
VTPVSEPEPYQRQLAPYESALHHGGPLYLLRAGAGRQALDIHRWIADADAADESLLDRCSGPTLDIGCGPGRLVAALIRRGVPALGIDLAHTAVGMTTDAGAAALRRSVFDPLPGEGRWSTALLADGNIGIGGDPPALLARIHTLLRPAGRLLVEADHEDAHLDDRFAARVADAWGRTGTTFRWARVGVHALTLLAAGQGFTTAETWTHSGRVFAALTRKP